MTYTKGHWILTENGDGRLGVFPGDWENAERPGQVICVPDTKANAHLIAAAPELLSFIQRHFTPGKVGFATILELYHDTTTCEAPQCCGHCLMVKEARELLTKAEGK